MTKKKLKKRKDFRFPTELITWAEHFAQRKNKSVTQLIVDLLTELRENNS